MGDINLKAGDVKRFITTKGDTLLGLILENTDKELKGYFLSDVGSHIYRSIMLSDIATVKTVRLTPEIRKGYENLYLQWQKTGKLKEKIKDKISKRDELAKEIRSLMEKDTEACSSIENTFMYLCYSFNGVMDTADFVNYILNELRLSYLYHYCAMGTSPYEGNYSEINGDCLMFVNTKEVDRMYGSELEQNGLAYKEYDDTYSTYSYKRVKDNKVFKSWVARVAMAHKYFNKKVEPSYSYNLGDKGRICMFECVGIKLTKALTKEYADFIVSKLKRD